MSKKNVYNITQYTQLLKFVYVLRNCAVYPYNIMTLIVWLMRWSRKKDQKKIYNTFNHKYNFFMKN